MATNNTSSYKRSTKPAALLGLALVMALLFPSGRAYGIEASDEAVRDFFRSVEEAFRDKDVPELISHIGDTFIYVMTYSNGDDFTYLESDYSRYRKSVGSFFMSKPVIHEYSILVEDIQRKGEDINVLAKVRSVVELNEIINSCVAASNYQLNYVAGEFIIKGVRGNANCANEPVKQAE